MDTRKPGKHPADLLCSLCQCNPRSSVSSLALQKNTRCSLTSPLPTYPLDLTDHHFLTLPPLIVYSSTQLKQAMPARKPSGLSTGLLLPLSLLPWTQSLSCFPNIAADDSCSQQHLQAAYMYSEFHRQPPPRSYPGNSSLHCSLQHQHAFAVNTPTEQV